MNERMRINGREIDNASFAAIFTRLRALIEELLAAHKLRAHPTYFECITAMAFEYFGRERVEFGVFEVGLGGRLDATNILSPVVTIITRIDFDHENFLGHSLKEIAGEKAGILKPGVPVIVTDQRPEAREVILGRARQLGCPAIETGQVFQAVQESSQSGFFRARVVELASGDSFEVAPGLPGRFQLQNAVNAMAAARQLARRGFRISPRDITEGIAKTVWPGRLEKLQSGPDIFLDGAHNPGAAREVARFLEENFAGRKIWLIYGALRDKAVDEVAGQLFPHAAEVIFTEPRTSRAISAPRLAEIASHHASRFTVSSSAEQALDQALAEAAPEDAIFVTGSLYLVGQLRQYWRQREQVAAR
jgi:dihydrofolate synthase/folylpolyglutamate synthase